MAKAVTLYRTTIGKKAVMAVTGLILYGFVVIHMLGNLQVFLGPEQFNGYAAKLRNFGALLWVARGVLVVALLAHLVAFVQLYAGTSGARSSRYKKKKNPTTTVAALTMKYGGVALFLFIVYHLAHFTVPGLSMSSAYKHDPLDVYSNFVHGFRVPWVSGIYILAQLFLGLHLYHGSWSLLQTLGFNHPKYNERRRFFAQTLGVVVATGNILMPIAVLTGFVQ